MPCIVKQDSLNLLEELKEEAIRCCSLTERGSAVLCDVLHWIPHGHFNASRRRMKRQRVEKEKEDAQETASSWNCSRRLKQLCTDILSIYNEQFLSI